MAPISSPASRCVEMETILLSDFVQGRGTIVGHAQKGGQRAPRINSSFLTSMCQPLRNESFFREIHKMS